MINYLRKIIGYNNPLRRGWHLFKGIVAAIKYGYPAKQMVIIGITGTNGKTTTTHMLEHLLYKAGKKVAMMSTVEFKINGKQRPNESKKTTLSPFATQRFLKECLTKKVDYVVLEASSHALHQYRLWGIPFEIAVMTNITHEHLDYHGTLEEYAEVKKELFYNASANCKKTSNPEIKHIPHQHSLVLNKTDQFYKDFNKIKCPCKVNYGIDEGDLKAIQPTYSKYGSKFEIGFAGDQIEVEMKIPGSFNVENALAATGGALACKLKLEDVKKGLESFEGVEGRMERISSPRGFEVIVDFALTPDSLEKLYKEIKQTASGKVIGLIGSCGDRDQEKRPVMGEIVAKYTDITIVTDEEPYSEDPMQIMKMIYEGVKRIKNKDLHLIEDRYNAIEFAVKEAGNDDIIVVTGMGNFATRTLNHGPIPWDERDVVREIISKNL